MLNFLQKKEGGDEDPIKAMNEKLKEAGLAQVWKHEHKQRALVYAIINTEANNALTFTQ